MTAEKRVRFEAIVKGRVQGVGFRYATQTKATELGVAGMVRNRWDGTVQVRAQGPEGAVRELLHWLYTGPRMALVEDVQVTWQVPNADEADCNRFEVRF